MLGIEYNAVKISVTTDIIQTISLHKLLTPKNIDVTVAVLTITDTRNKQKQTILDFILFLLIFI